MPLATPWPPHPFLLPTLSTRDVCSSLGVPGEIRRQPPPSADAGPDASPWVLEPQRAGGDSGVGTWGPSLQAGHVPGPGYRWTTKLSFLPKGRALEKGAHRCTRHGAVITPAGGVQSPHTEGRLNTEAETVLHTKTHSSLQPHRHKSNDAPRTFLSHTHTHTHTEQKKHPICDLALHDTPSRGRIINKTCF